MITQVPEIVLIYVEAGLGPRVIASRLQQQMQLMGASCTTYSLSTLIPHWLHRRLLGQYRTDCMSNTDTLSRWHTQPWRFSLLYKCMTLIELTPAPAALASLCTARYVVATSYLAAFFLDRLRCQWHLDFEIVGVLGDYGTSPGWRVNLDSLCIPAGLKNPTLTWLHKRGVDLICSGVPTNPPCSKQADRSGHVLVCGGGWGLGDAYYYIDHLLSHRAVTRVTTVCGDNRSTLTKLHQRHANSIAQGRLRLVGLVDDISPLLGQAIAVVTKPGGLTLSEAAANGTLMLLTAGITEHERCNARYFLSQNAALDASTIENLEFALDELGLSSPRIAELTINARRLAGENSLSTISQWIINKKGNQHVDH